LAISCSRDNSTTGIFPVPENTKIKLKYHTVKIDTIILHDEGVESSLVGFSGINHDNDYYFIDQRLCWYYVFDLEGNFKNRFFGYGQGPNETTAGKIAACCVLADTSLFLLSHQLDHYHYDKNFNTKNFFYLVGNQHDGNPVENWRAYTHRYANLKCRSYGNDKVYFNIYSEHPDFNYLQHTDLYLEKCYHLFEVDIVSEEPGKMYAAGFPSVYYKDPYSYVIFSDINYDIDNDGCFYVSYVADSLIYKYDHKYTPLYSFGYSGKNMNTKYEKITSWENSRKHYERERIDKGYYDWIEYIDDTGLLFRSYKKGSHDPTDGLQIYSDKTLIADLSVPKDLKVAGYVAPYYYSQAIADEEKEILFMYRFKLD
jgi:hypothetical protein